MVRDSVILGRSGQDPGPPFPFRLPTSSPITTLGAPCVLICLDLPLTSFRCTVLDMMYCLFVHRRSN